MLDDLGLGQLDPFLWYDHGLNRLAPNVVGYTDDGCLGHPGVGHDGFLHLTRIDVEPTGDNHIGLAVHDVDVAILIHRSHVTSVKPAALEDISCLIGHLPVLLKQLVGAEQNHTNLARLDLPALLAHNLDLDTHGRPAC